MTKQVIVKRKKEQQTKVMSLIFSKPSDGSWHSKTKSNRLCNNNQTMWCEKATRVESKANWVAPHYRPPTAAPKTNHKSLVDAQNRQ